MSAIWVFFWEVFNDSTKLSAVLFKYLFLVKCRVKYAYFCATIYVLSLLHLYFFPAHFMLISRTLKDPLDDSLILSLTCCP